ncbi:unnamed protein product, partial [Nesidiocoris tenuis]
MSTHRLNSSTAEYENDEDSDRFITGSCFLRRQRRPLKNMKILFPVIGDKKNIVAREDVRSDGLKRESEKEYEKNERGEPPSVAINNIPLRPVLTQII